MRRKERELTKFEETESIIMSSDVCRISFADDNMPYMVTMNFGFMKGIKPELYFHCAKEGRKIEMIRKNNYVCFEMDTDHEIRTGEKPCDWGMKFRSVVGYGKIFIVKDDEERKMALDHIMDHYGGKGSYEYDKKDFERTTTLRLEISEMTAKSSH